MSSSMAVLFDISPSNAPNLAQAAMPCILKTLHNSPYYSHQVPRTTSNLTRRDDAGGGEVAVVVIVVIVAITVVSVGLLLIYGLRLTTRRRPASGENSKDGAKIWSRTPKFGSKFVSGSLRPRSSKKIRREPRERKGFERFGSEVDNVEYPTLPTRSYIGRFQAASALEIGEGYELSGYAGEHIKEVLRPRQGSFLAPGELYRNIARKPKIETTSETVRFQPGEVADIFVIGEEGDDEVEPEDPRYTFNSDDLPEQWGKKRDPNSDSARVSVDLTGARPSSDLETREDYTPRSSKRTSWTLRHGITERCYRHLNDPEEALDCIICQGLSMDSGFDHEPIPREI